MELSLVRSNDPVLLEPCDEFDFVNPQVDPIEFAQALVKFMYENNGVGLSANQVGYPFRVFAMRGHPQNFVCYNPRVITQSDQFIQLEEGCLSYPGLIVKIKRPQFVRVRFQLPNGDTMTQGFYGLAARVFQHELDHLNGLKFYDRANFYHREKALKNWKNNRHGRSLDSLSLDSLSSYLESTLELPPV
jgi:peptide deformylase